MKKSLFISVALLGLLCSFPSFSCVTPWQGDEKVSKKPSLLHAAIKEGNLSKVKLALKLGADINQKQYEVCYGYITNHGSTPLARAVSNGDTKIVKYLIERGADLKNIDDYHEGIGAFYGNAEANTLFSYAQTEEMVHFLAQMFKEKGVLSQIVAYENKKIENVAFKTIYKCNENMLKTLLSYGIKLNKKRDFLNKAIMTGYVDGTVGYKTKRCPISFIKFLIEQGGEIKNTENVQKVFTNTLYYYPELVSVFFKEPNIKEEERPQKQTHSHAYRPDTGLIDINATIDHLDTKPLDIAVQQKNVKLASFLIKKGAKSEYALLGAVDIGDFNMVKLLVENGFNVNQTHKRIRDNYTPFLLAVKENKQDIALFLIEKGANVNARDKEGKGALHYKGAYKSDLYKKIIQAGADLNIADMDGKKPYHVARRYLRGDQLKSFTTSVSTQQNNITQKAAPCNGIDFIKKDEKGQTALHTVADVQLAECFIRYGADLNALNIDGQPPLFTQLIMNQKDVYEILFSNFVKTKIVNGEYKEPFHQDNFGNTLLHYMAMNKDFSNIPDYFSKTNKNIQNKKGITPLHYAMQYENKDFVRFLLNDKNTKLNIKDNQGRTPIFYLKKYPSRGSYNLERFDLNVKDNKGNTPLVYVQDMYLFQELYSKGARFPSIINLSSQEAQEANTYDLLRRKIKALMKMPKRDKKDVRQLVQIIALSNDQTIQQFVKDEASNEDLLSMLFEYLPAEKKGQMETELLFKTFEKGDFYTLKKLIQKGADVNATNSAGETLLEKAIFSSKRIGVIQSLLEAGADINHVDSKGKTILDKLEKQNSYFNPVLVNLLVKYGAKRSSDLNSQKTRGSAQSSSSSDTDIPPKKETSPILKKALHHAIITRNNDMLINLINRGADVNEVHAGGMTLLSLAISTSNTQAVKLLLENGADVNKANMMGKSLLLTALLLRRYDLAELLIKHGADVNEKDNLGRPIFHIVVQMNKDFVQLFLENGVDVEAKDARGRTVFDQYISEENKTLLQDYLNQHKNK